MFDSIRARLTAWYVAVLAGVLVGFGIVVYLALTEVLYRKVDRALASLVTVVATSLTHDAEEGQSPLDAARSTVVELTGEDQSLAVFDAGGRLLARQLADEELRLDLGPPDEVPLEAPAFSTVTEVDDADRHRLAIRAVTIHPGGQRYIVMAGHSLEDIDDELASVRTVFASAIPVALLVAAIGGWLMARQSLAPVAAMADQAGRLGAETAGKRLPVANARDELGRLAGAFNALLARMDAAFAQQRQFMADASHELRTPIATLRTAATVTLQQPHRDEVEYRETLAIMEEQTRRLSRVVDDMFTLARADAGRYPLRTIDLYLDSLVQEVASTARVLAAGQAVEVSAGPLDDAPFVGDEDLLRRMLMNLVENAVRYTPAGGTVQVSLERRHGRYHVVVTDSGTGIPAAAQSHVFERFYQGDPSRSRTDASRGAGLGLAIARWIARAHHGDLKLVTSSPAGTTFEVELPADPGH
jgi:two-component system OmpR family sensor kinase